MMWRLIIFCLLFIGCNMENNNKSNNKPKQSMNQQTTNQSELKKAILLSGDIAAYQLLNTEYLDYTFPEEFLLYAMIMANKYDYPQAHFDVFTCLTDIYLSDLNQLDEKTASLAIDYLLKAYEKGHHQAKEMVEEYKITSNENSRQQIERIFKD
jgi:hypothetical protein